MGYSEQIYEQAVALGGEVAAALAPANDLRARADQLSREVSSLRAGEESRHAKLVEATAAGKAKPAEASKAAGTWAFDSPAANDAPTVTVAAGGTCGKDDHSGTIYLAVRDAETPATVVTLSAASSNPSLVPTGNVVFAGSGETRMLTVSAVDGRSGTAIVTATVNDGQESSQVEVTVRVGGSGKDTITGGSGADLIFAQSNNDTLIGGDGNDLLCGDSGGDTLAGGAGDDSLGGGSRSDKLSGGSGADRFGGGAGTDAATDFATIEGDTTDGTIP